MEKRSLFEFLTQIEKRAIVFLIFIFILSAFTYSQIINLQSKLGSQYFHTVRVMESTISRTIESLDKDNVSELEFHRNLEGIRIAFLSAVISDRTFIDYNEKVIYTYDLNRVITEPEYRNEFVQRLEALENAFNSVIEDMEVYRDNHIRATKIPHAFSLRNNPNKAYYDYFSRRPDRSEIHYKSKFHELIDKKFNQNLID